MVSLPATCLSFYGYLCHAQMKYNWANLLRSIYYCPCINAEETYSQSEIVEKSAEENTNEEPVVVVVSEISSNKGKINDESSTL